MLIYVYLYVSLLLGLIMYKRVNEKVGQMILVLLAFFVVCLPAFRCADSSADTQNYIDHFLYPDRGYNGEETEPLYDVYVRIVGYLFHNWKFFITISTLSAIIPLFFLVYKESLNKCLSLYLFVTFGPIIFFYLMYFGNIRQTLSLGFLSLALYFLSSRGLKDNFKVSIINYLIASFIHYSSFIAISYYIVDRIRLTKKQLIYIVLIALFLSQSNILSYFSFLKTDDIFYFNTDNLGATGTTFTLLFPLIISVYMVFSSSIERFNDDLWMKLFFFQGLLLFLFSGSIANNIDRFVLAFFPAALIAIPNYFAEHNQLKDKFFFMVIIGFYGYRFFTVLKIQLLQNIEVGSTLIPYMSYFE